MFNTPHKGVVTRRTKTRLEQEQRELIERQAMEAQALETEANVQPATEALSGISTYSTRHVSEKAGTSVKSELVPHDRSQGQAPRDRTAYSCISKSSLKSTSKSARIKLQLEAAKKKAQIQMDLIDKTLEAQLAELSEEEELKEYSSQYEGKIRPPSNIEEWVEHQSNHFEPQLEQQAPEHGNRTGELRQPVPASTPAVPPASVPACAPAQAAPPLPDTTITALTHTVQMLAGALKDLSTANVGSEPNGRLLGRLSTPKDLPVFAGDPMEWLQFKQAYEESTEVCRFTDKENLWRLRKCLKGSAKDTVTALFISATSPDKVMSTLALRFGNPDCIISRVLQDVKRLQPLHQDYHRDIVSFAIKVQNYVESVRALGREEYLQGVSIVPTILCKLPAVLLSKWSDYSYNLIVEGNKPRLVILSEFLNEEAVKISSTASIFSMGRNDCHKHKSYDNPRIHTVLAQDTENYSKCQFCRISKHMLTDCKQFKKALRKVRWQYVKLRGLCYKCLLSRHDRMTCPAPMCDKDNCGQGHHRLLHYVTNNNIITETSDVQAQQPPESSQATETLTHVVASEQKVLLKVVPISIRGPNGTVHTTALLDDGSTVSLMSYDIAQRLGLRGHTETLRMTGAWNNNVLVCESTVTNVDLISMDNKVYNIKVRCVNEFNLPMQKLSVLKCNNYSHLLELKDMLCCSDTKPQILIGQDNYHLLSPIKLKVGKINEPSATLTPLGWCVHGMLCVPQISRPSCRSPTARRDATVCALDWDRVSDNQDVVLREIHEEVRRSFAIDSLGVCSKPRQNADEVRAISQLERSAKLIDGRWVVGLPWKDETRMMPNSYHNALRRLKGVERKMGKDSSYAARYQERVNHLLKNNFARELMDTGTSAPSCTWYLPHFGVDNPNKSKLRLVFDAADRINGKCLNDYLLTGPDLLSSLFGIMLRFRENKIAVTGDIRDMFLRIKISDEDQHALRFLWRNNPTENIKTYVMSSLIFGANCSPFVAQFIKNKNAKRYESSLPAAVEAICNSHYMDDYIDSLHDEAHAIEMVKNVSNIHKSGGFEIRNWVSNSIKVLDSVPKETLGAAAVSLKLGQQYESGRTLGLLWYPTEDTLGFDVSLKRLPINILNGTNVRPTKRLMLKVIMSIFDVLGFLSPFTIQGKIMLQDTWQLKIGWDDNIPDTIYFKWQKWIELLKEISNVRIPRCYNNIVNRASEGKKTLEPVRVNETGIKSVTYRTIPRSYAPAADTSPTITATQRATPATDSRQFVAADTSATSASDYRNLQLHVFSDASTKAMSAVAYWRWYNNGVVYVSFIASKCRVMPVKILTVPRAELQAAVLAARLANTIVKEHRMISERRYFWCDSTTVIHWIRNNTRTYKTFEANRLGEIDELTRVHEWNYIPTNLNIADLATRESFDPTQLVEWFNGPNFLYSKEGLWPKDIIQLDKDIISTDVVTLVQDVLATLPVPDPKRFSSWLRLLRTMATVLKFIDRCKGIQSKIDCSTMERAERLLLMYVQTECYAEEIAAIKGKRLIKRNSKLLTLSPYLGDDGLLRVGGRIDAAKDVPIEMKRPIILDGKHHIARLIIRHYHVKAAHGSQETVVNELKQKYWLVRLRPSVKSVVSRCMLCRIQKCTPQVPRMGDLPDARVAHHQRPFTFCGLDLFGPILVTVGRRREKRYGVLFTCLTVRAVHVELVSSLTSDSLIMALRRMAARRGWPCHLYSDNGTNLRGADKELQCSLREQDSSALKTEGVNHGMVWSFIPPASPHWGGAWERLIRSVKTSLKVVLNERAPREEVLVTLMAEVENIVNSRPLVHVSVEPGSVESLTPNHFLIGSSSNLPVVGVFDDSDLYRRKQWRIAQRLVDMFWRRWVKEILPTLLPRRKWQEDQKPLQVGDFVLLVDPHSPRNTWPKGLITRVFPGKDGRIRTVEVKTQTGTLRRSAVCVAPVSLVDECCTSTGVGSVSDA